MAVNTEIVLIRTNASSEDFQSLVNMLDEELAVRDGKEHDFYHQFNLLDDIKYVVVAYWGHKPASCGAIKAYDSESMEVKRMYTLPMHRGKGIAGIVLKELESWTKDLGYTDCVLETGKKQPEAIALYQKNGYSIVENYGQYIGVENSVCFRKKLN